MNEYGKDYHHEEIDWIDHIHIHIHSLILLDRITSSFPSIPVYFLPLCPNNPPFLLHSILPPPVLRFLPPSFLQRSKSSSTTFYHSNTGGTSGWWKGVVGNEIAFMAMGA